MPKLSWTPLEGRINLVAATSVSDIWMIAVEDFAGATWLRIEAAGEWDPLPRMLARCGPDGIAGISVPADRLIIPEVAYGALIGRFGGGTAYASGTPSDAWAKPFAIGRYCTVRVPNETIGPLFIAINSLCRPVSASNFTLTIKGAIPPTVP